MLNIDEPSSREDGQELSNEFGYQPTSPAEVRQGMKGRSPVVLSIMGVAILPSISANNMAMGQLLC
jgi:hypothetical protein